MKVSIIGGGVAGLSAGCYLQMSGFESTIFERGNSPGGLCTSWKKGVFTFESGFQWLLGSGPANPFYLLWSELLDMDSIKFVNHEVRIDIEVKDAIDIHGDKVFHLYTNLDRLKSYLLDIAPEDRIPVEKLIRDMRKVQSFEIPPMVRTVPELLSPFKKIKFIRYIPLLLFLNRYKKETNFSFASKLRNPFLKEAFELLFDGEEQSLMVISLPLAFSDKHATGYPVGGASCFVEKLKQRYLSLGGTIHYKAGVKEIITENNSTIGVLLEKGERVVSDFTLSAADWNFTMFSALGGAYANKGMIALHEQKKLKIYYSVFMVSLGIGRSLAKEPHYMRFPLKEELVSPDGTIYRRLESHIFNYDPTLAPNGKTVLSASFYTMNGDYWINLRETDPELYKRQKMEFAKKVIGLLDQKFGNIRAKVEEADVATPATFYRYTGNFKGSVQGWLPGKNIVAPTPVKYTAPGLKRFYYAGHWSIPGGGLPVAVKAARDAVQLLCHEAQVPFSTTSVKSKV